MDYNNLQLVLLLKNIGAEYISSGFVGLELKIFDKEKFVKYLIYFRNLISEEKFKMTFNDVKLERRKIINLPIILFEKENFDTYLVEFRKEKLNNLEI